MKNQRGFALVPVLILIGTASVLVFLYLQSFVVLMRDGLNDVHREQARLLAEGGIEYGLVQLRSGHRKLEKELTLDLGRVSVKIESHANGYAVTAIGQVNRHQLFTRKLRVNTTASGHIREWFE